MTDKHLVSILNECKGQNLKTVKTTDDVVTLEFEGQGLNARVAFRIKPNSFVSHTVSPVKKEKTVQRVSLKDKESGLAVVKTKKKKTLT